MRGERNLEGGDHDRVRDGGERVGCAARPFVSRQSERFAAGADDGDQHPRRESIADVDDARNNREWLIEFPAEKVRIL